MSKIKENLMYQQDTKLEYETMFMDTMYSVLNPEARLSESDIIDMEKSYGNSSQPVNFQSNVSVPTQSINLTETTRKSA